MAECRACVYWQGPTKKAAETAVQRGGDIFGQCRFAAPVLIRTDSGFRGMWPTTTERQWCGQHTVLAPPSADE